MADGTDAEMELIEHVEEGVDENNPHIEEVGTDHWHEALPRSNRAMLL